MGNACTQPSISDAVPAISAPDEPHQSAADLHDLQNLEKSEAGSHGRHSVTTKMTGVEMLLDVGIDEGLYSRQLYVLGHDAMKKMALANILISGMGGIGAEIAKNVILSGVKSVTLHDTKNVEMADMSSHFYFCETDVGWNRAEVSCPKLAELNSYVAVMSNTEPLTEDLIKAHSVVVLTSAPLEEQLKVAKITRANNIALIIGETAGLYAQVFNDFGANFVVRDSNGEPPLTSLISVVTQNGDVVTLDEVRHGFEDDDVITFSEVEGMTELNGTNHKIKVLGPFTFKIGDTSGYSEYSKGGVATQVKVAQELEFVSLLDALDNPKDLFIMTDFAKCDAPPQLHLAFKTMHEFRKRNQRLPVNWSEDDSANFLNLGKELNSKSLFPIDIDIPYLDQFSKICAGDLSPMAAAIGGIVAQEVIKACSGKFMPIKQWLYFDALECLPEDTSKPTEESCQPTGSRYDGQIAIFGKDFQDRMTQQKFMVVGAGAIGCELLKNFALMGLGASEEGKIIVTDMDHIEKSNLNRQFLFRSWDVGKLKSDVAAAAVKLMNPDLNIEAHQNRVGVESEDIYNDDFFENLNGVANALDNIEARNYMDRRCVYYRLPLLESGTLGTKGNTQVVIPDLTESYGSTHDPPEKSIPICTLKNFPNQIEHTLQWARDLFEGTFTQAPGLAVQYLGEPDFVERTKNLPGAQPLEIFESVKKFLVDDNPGDFKDCVKWARNFWQSYFHNDIAQLIHNFPPDQLTSTGQLFWSGPKKCPVPLDFNPSCKLHMDFVVAAANLQATVYGLEGSADLQMIHQMLSTIEVPVFSPRENIAIAANDSEVEALANSAQVDLDQIADLESKLPPQPEVLNIVIHPAQFDKDDDANFHMDFIVAASNTRAENYGITTADRHKSKLIAGRIIPAIATTTSLVGGLVCLELIKLVQGHKNIEVFKNGFVNLALPFITFSEPIRAPYQEYNGIPWTLWNRFNLNNESGKEMTLEELINYFKEGKGLEITMISYGVCMLYSFFMNEDARNKRMSMAMSRVVVDVSKKEIPSYVKSLVFEICCDDLKGEDVEVPFIVYKLPPSDAT